MRQAKKGKGTNKLTDDMIDRLNGIGFEWNLVKSYDERMKELEEDKSKFGDCCVPYGKEGYKSLKYWVKDMRKARKGKGNMKLTGEMIVSLNDIGFFWGRGQSAEFSDAEKEKFGMITP